ncbi:unnamed protein product [Sphagnum troendelagicum]|uniref:BZIP transcription factor n=2 Tax=Sphagnum TaxID=13804 RepID=A0ABP0V1B2_9BRYO|nr:hypothetical protein BDL97_08G129800 [Sphagnum fallax]
MADNSPRLKDTAASIADHEAATAAVDQGKALRRLAQNREAARKSRLRKKAYVQQLESSRVKLNQLEQELQSVARQEHINQHQLIPQYSRAVAGAGANAAAGAVRRPAARYSSLDIEYGRWIEEQQRQMRNLRAALMQQEAAANDVSENQLRLLVDENMRHYEQMFRLKAVAARSDVFHIVSGMWKTPVERICFMWMGGFRPSQLLKILIPQIEPLTEQQLVGICNLQQSSQEAEDALSQGMEALQQSLAETVANGLLGRSPTVANYMSQMTMAMSKLSMLESFVHQADNLRRQVMQQMLRILTTHQAARGLLGISDHFTCLQALSSLWSARPQD